ncbi:Platinum sensitivity protein [Mortierella sp. GBA43]|nr:Platinum sensitivity protein [Mortierella sp. GBA43]
MLGLPLATLIVWSEDDVDLALSFQEAEGCTEIWGDISKVMRADDLYFPDPVNDLEEHVVEKMTLPDPTIINLKEIDDLIKSVQDNAEKEKLFTLIVSNDYIKKLFPILETCEDLENLSDLYLLHSIMLGIIHLNDFAAVIHILKDDHFLNCVGMLEYDPRVHPKADHREFLTKRSKFKQIVPIKDPKVEQKIHQVFRLQYLRDRVLTRFLDESLSGVLESMIFFHNTEIVNAIHQDHNFLRELFGILESTTETLERKRDVVRFVQQKLCQSGLFGLFELALADDDKAIKMAGAEIMVSALEHDGGLVRSHMVDRAADTNRRQVFDVLLSQFLVEKDAGIIIQFSELIRGLLDMNPNITESGMPMLIECPTNPDPNANKFLELFYSSYVDMFVSPLMSLTEDMMVLDRLLATRCENICNILSFMVRQHCLRGKNYILPSGIIGKVCILLKNRDRHLRLSALKFFRTCIGLVDDSYHQELIAQNVLHHIVQLLLETRSKNNLTNSLCLEFFEHIKTANIRSLSNHVVTNYRRELEIITYTNTFKVMIHQYEQQQQQEQEKLAPEASTNEAVTNNAEEGSTVHLAEIPHQDVATSDSNDDVSTGAQHDATATAGSSRRRKFSNHSDNWDHEESGASNIPENAGDEQQSPNKRKRPNDLILSLGSSDPSSQSDESTSAASPVGSPLNRRSPSPQLSPTTASMRTDIVFVKAGTDMKDRKPSSEHEANKIQEAMRLKSELATGSRYPTEDIQLTKRKRDSDEEIGALDLRAEPRRRSNSSDHESNHLPLILTSSSMIPTSLAMQDSVMAPRITPDSLRMGPHDTNLPSREVAGGSVDSAPLSITVE